MGLFCFGVGLFNGFLLLEIFLFNRSLFIDTVSSLLFGIVSFRGSLLFGVVLFNGSLLLGVGLSYVFLLLEAVLFN